MTETGPSLGALTKLRHQVRSQIVRRAIDITNADNIVAYAPASAGSTFNLTRLGLQAAGQTPHLLARLAAESGAISPLEVSADEFYRSHGAIPLDKVQEAFQKEGSDKTAHGYHLVYGPILVDLGNPSGILEVGLGTNNEDVVSNMGSGGVVGASLRAFRSLAPNARIFGADVDTRILFSEDRIETYFVDQTDSATITSLGENLPNNLDLVIDDGLHSPNANIGILLLGLEKVRAGGWIVIEDIRREAVDIWRVVGALLGAQTTSTIVDCGDFLMFCVKRAPADGNGRAV